MQIEPGTGAGVVVTFANDEKEILRKLISEMRWLLRSETSSRDPVMARLFPDAYEAADDEASYRELVGDDLEKGKLQALGVVEESLDGPNLSAEQIEAWLTALTDIRLAIGTRLDIDETKMEAGIDPDDPDAATISILHWLGWIQESLLQAMTEGSE